MIKTYVALCSDRHGKHAKEHRRSFVQSTNRSEPFRQRTGKLMWAGCVPEILRALVIPLTCLIASSTLISQEREAYQDKAGLAYERELRATDPKKQPTLKELRSAIDNYEAIVRQQPQSIYGDNALWQATGLALETFDRFRDDYDLQTALRLLHWLPHQYPKSPFISRIKERLEQLNSLDKPVTLKNVRRELLSEVVRISIELTSEVRYEHGRFDNPSRLFIDLKGAISTPALRDTHIQFSDDDIVRGINLHRRPNDTVRVILDAVGIATYNVFNLYNPYRLIIDCHRGDRGQLQARIGETASSTQRTTGKLLKPVTLDDPPVNANETLSLARQLGLNVSRIVIDPGHGGQDPGARDNHLTEADLVLDIALRLEKRLMTFPQIDVVLTRRTNVFVPLEERTSIANREHADLFLSIHANASKNPTAHGVETYLANFALDPQSEALAARENSTSDSAMYTLPLMIREIALGDKLDESRYLAEIIQRTMVETLKHANPQLRDIGIKQAPFVVLIGATMPSVLTEIAFLTNRAESELLKQNHYLNLITDALVNSIVNYRNSLKNTRIIPTQGIVGGS